MDETMGGQPLANFARHDVDVGFKNDNSHDNVLEITTYGLWQAFSEISVPLSQRRTVCQCKNLFFLQVQKKICTCFSGALDLYKGIHLICGRSGLFRHKRIPKNS